MEKYFSPPDLSICYWKDDQRAKRAADLAYALMSELEGLTENSIKKFAKLVSAQDAGYLAGRINNVYNTDKLKSWVGKATYIPDNKPR